MWGRMLRQTSIAMPLEKFYQMGRWKRNCWQTNMRCWETLMFTKCPAKYKYVLPFVHTVLATTDDHMQQHVYQCKYLHVHVHTLYIRSRNLFFTVKMPNVSVWECVLRNLCSIQVSMFATCSDVLVSSRFPIYFTSSIGRSSVRLSVRSTLILS